MKAKKSKSKEKILMEYGWLKIKNKYYRPEAIKEYGRPGYVEVDGKTMTKRITLLKEIASKLKASLDPEMVIMEALGKIDSDEYLENIHNALYNSKRKIKPKTRRHHCVDMKIGKMMLPIN